MLAALTASRLTFYADTVTQAVPSPHSKMYSADPARWDPIALGNGQVAEDQ